MKKSIILFFLSLTTIAVYAQDGKQLVTEMIAALGGKQNFYNLGNVTYDYEYQDPNSGLHFKGKEAYIFDGELSRADFTIHTMLAPKGGQVTEGYDGTNFWVSLDGQDVQTEQALGFARFLRKTNYYWFTMFFKLLDDGVNQEFIGTKQVDGKDYNLVRITFGDDIGDAQDTYVLYINTTTKLVDQFLFTITAFGVTEPKLMRFNYEIVNGIKIPSDRTYINADWEGNITGEKAATTTWKNIKFGTVTDSSFFSKKE